MKTTIDRCALVKRHWPVIKKLEPLSPLSVGNGEFAFTADLTGLQSYPEQYQFPLGTQSQWGWHSSQGLDAVVLDDLQMEYLDTCGRQVPYPINSKGQEQAFHWLRQNPHRLQLGQIGLRLLSANGEKVMMEELQEPEQTLDLWRGLLISRFQVEGSAVQVITCCHPESDQLGVWVESVLLQQGRLEVAIAFPAPELASTNWSHTTGLNWEAQVSHETKLESVASDRATFVRSMEGQGYLMSAAWTNGHLVQTAGHEFRLIPSASTQRLELVAGFSRLEVREQLHTFAEIKQASEHHWERFWMTGGAIELAGSTDPRAHELERRIVLSQYLTAIHCAGSLPPQETGLLYNSWFGKFHLEMHWWHAAHFALWGRTPLLKKSLEWYRQILPAAKRYAQMQGYAGARWPKMVGPDGRESPSIVGSLLIWQQPHPILLTELCYQAEPSGQTLGEFGDIVFETADFMADFAVWDGSRYVLGPPVIPAQENHKPADTCNPTFELEYWRHALDIALTWRIRLGLPAVPKWQHVRDQLAQLPVQDGVYLAHEHCPDTFTRFNTDHPSMLAALGVLPGKKVDPDVMRTTLLRVLSDWQWETAWGWDFPVAAMTASRLGEGTIAVDCLLMDTTKNTYLPSGHNYQRSNLLAYLPGNGGLLAASAMMACGWQEGPDTHAPGFPADGSWTVRWEGLNAWL